MNLPDWIRILQVAFGIGLIIFVHEMGHFLAARWCGVRVDVFSLGFGPKLLSFERGDTTYQLAAVPFGGYVRMAGELPDGSGRPPAHDELSAKSVPQRFLIYSGGVLMNMLFALVMFPIALSSGVSSAIPIVTTVPGSPAWHARIPDGSRVVSANGKEIWDWPHIPTEVAIGGSDTVELELLLPGASEPSTVVLQPERNESVGVYMVGLGRAVDPSLEFQVRAGGAAERAGLREGDVLVGVEGGLVGFRPEQQYRDALREGPVDLIVRRGSETLSLHIDPDRPESTKTPVFGIRPIESLIGDLRSSSSPVQMGLRVDDRIETIYGRAVSSRSDIFHAINEGHGPLAITILRDGKTLELLGPDLDQQGRVAFLNDLALAQDNDGTGILVMPYTGAEEAGLLSGDRVLALSGTSVASWDDIQLAAQNAVQLGRPLVFSVARGSETLDIEAVPLPPPVLDYGCDLKQARYTYRTHGLIPSMKAGALASWRFLSEAWLTLQKMFQSEVSTKNLGGIITIGQVSYHWSAMGWTKLLFFLCMVSVNLAFLNVLPIPVLDGGHLFFLLVEGIKGSPVSERTLGYSQVVGIVLILSLMVYVTYNDVLRLVTS